MYKDGNMIDCSSHDLLISEVQNYSSFIINKCDAVLVVEKEAVFRSLTTIVNGISDGPRCILITGRGCKLQSHKQNSA